MSWFLFFLTATVIFMAVAAVATVRWKHRTQLVAEMTIMLSIIAATTAFTAAIIAAAPSMWGWWAMAPVAIIGIGALWCAGHLVLAFSDHFRKEVIAGEAIMVAIIIATGLVMAVV